MGTSDWEVTGRAIIVAERKSGEIGLPESNLHGLQYSCLIQTYFGKEPKAGKSSIKRDFLNLDVGVEYRLSFWQTRRSGREIPMLFGVKVDGKLVYSTMPSTDDWVHVWSESFTPASSSAEVLFEISSSDRQDRNIAFNEISVVRSEISGVEGMCHLYQFIFVYVHRYL